MATLPLLQQQTLAFRRLRRKEKWASLVRAQKKVDWQPKRFYTLDIEWPDEENQMVFLVERLEGLKKLLFFEKLQIGLKTPPALYMQRMWLAIYKDKLTFVLEALLQEINDELCGSEEQAVHSQEEE
jgi:hypothetical protein